MPSSLADVVKSTSPNKSAPVDTQSLQPKPQHQRVVNEWPKCLECITTRSNCDGERPCSECTGCGIECNYETDPPARPQASNPTSEIAPAAQPTSEDVSGARVGSPNFASVFADIESEQDTDVDTDDDSPEHEALLDIKAIEGLLDQLRQRIYDFTEYTVRPILQQSRADSKLQDLSTIPQPGKSPFETLASNPAAAAAKLQLSVKDYNPHASLQKQKWNSLTAPLLQFQPDVSGLPRYKSIGRVHSSLLARNVTIGKYNNYLAEDEHLTWAFREQKYGEIEERLHTYTSISTTLHAQRGCAELVDIWRPWAEEFMKSVGVEPVDIIEFYTRDRDSPNLDHVGIKDDEVAKWVGEQSSSCELCRMENDWDQAYPWTEISSSLEPLRQYGGDATTLASAGLACVSFHENVGCSMWHIVSTMPAVKEVLDKQRQDPDAKGLAERMCLVCALHNCSIHGAYLEDPDLQVEHLEHTVDKIRINDPEENRNERSMVTLPDLSIHDSTKKIPKQTRKRKITAKSKKNKQDLGRNIPLDVREVFVPCSHTGPCQDNPACSCFKAKINCEHYCGCEHSCQRRWKGCSCATGSSRVCNNDARCECWNNSRECDPWLCKGCGVLEVLDQANKYNEDIRMGRCCNNRIQLGIPARTIKAPSEVQGYGLFAGEDLEEGDFIGEYQGEIISQPESDRRGAMYHLLGSEYLFILSATQQVDATNYSNKTRFINNSNLENNINVAGCLMLCSGVHRIMLHAKKRIKAGEELLYNYNYPEEVSKHFWERGEVASSKTAAIQGTVSKMATGAKKQQARRPKASNGQSEQTSRHESEDEIPESSQSPLIRRTVKRKFTDMDVPEVNTGEESEYSDDGVGIESSDDGEDAVVSSIEDSEDERPPQLLGGTRLNRHRLPDGRFGGESQRKAAETRRRRMAEQQ